MCKMKEMKVRKQSAETMLQTLAHRGTHTQINSAITDDREVQCHAGSRRCSNGTENIFSGASRNHGVL